MDLPDISSHLPDHEGFCRPDWEAIRPLIEAHVPESGWPAAWEAAARIWVDRLREQAGDGYEVHETRHFLLLTDAPARVVTEASRFYEWARGRILGALPGIALTEYLGKHVVLMFSQTDEYYRYLAGFVADGDVRPTSSGVCLSGGGYMHFAFPTVDNASYRGVLVHELTHFFVSHLPLPTWLNEALAMRMEDALCRSAPPRLDRELCARHAAHWNKGTIQGFWTGESWREVDEGNELSYNLAQILWRKIEEDLRPGQAAILAFIGRADFADAGESACREVFDLGLGDFVAEFLGEGEWAPDPAAWQGGMTAADANPWEVAAELPAWDWKMDASPADAESPRTWTGSSGDERRIPD